MFYSQFILAKKGPLGTIWIAAHLERKLRKNQVADTDIGVSVDTILCPEVPIALRLSSHLLLGVVRIYSRKVNYLFDDCSEALLKIKQAFRSTAVDLPPEESKAPYHSITLPETFDLDDFELPDNEFFQGNYVDHHTSTREQITLQDNMEGVVYPTSQFGLDERFGDGETSGLKLDEGFFLHKVDSAGHAGVSGDHQSFAEAATPMQDDGHGRLPALPESRVEILNVERDLMDYAQAPCTPGLVETPNLANIQFSACDDHMDEDDNPLVEFMLNGNAETISSKLSQHQENAQLVDWSLSDDINSIAAVDIPCEENGNHFIDLETEKRHSPNETRAQNISSDNPATASGTSFAVADEAQGSGQTSNLTQMAVSVSTLLYKKQDLENVILKGDGVNVPSVSNEDYRESNGIVFNGSAQNAVCSIASLQIPEGVSDDNQTTMFGEKSDMEVSGNPGGCISSNGGALELSQGLSSLENPHDIHTSNVSVCNEMTYPQVHVLRPCSTSLGLPNSFHPGGQVPNDLNMAPDVGAIPLESFGGGEMIHASEPAIVVQEGKLELNLEENYTAEPVSVEDIHVGSGISDNQRNNNLGGGSMLENATSSVSAVFPAPEKLLSLPEGHTNQQRGPLLDATPTDLACPDESDAGSRILPGKKRSYTASSLTEQSLYSVESARVFPTKRTSRAVPDDDDLLSSILVGRSSSVLKVKPTPPPYELTSLKRRRYTPRTSVSKRKVLLDDTMVLHGGTIRQQLIDTEDIRRLRKKAPCTLPEISSMRNQFLEDELFIEPLSSGVSVALGSLFNQGYDLSRIKVSKGVANVVSVLSSSDMKFISSNESTKNVTDSAPPVVETGVGDCGEFAAVKENCDLQHNKTISLTKNKLDEGHEMGSSITDLEINPKENKEVAEPTSSLSNLPNKLAGNEIGGTNTPSESVGVAQLTFPVIGVEADALVEMEAAVVSFDSKTMSENVVEPAVVSFDSKTVSENVVEPAVVSFDRKTVSENVVEPAVVSFDSKVESENVVEAAVVSFDNKVESENVNEAADDSFDDKGETENVMQEAVVSFDDKGGPENVMEAAVVSLDDQRESENVMEAAVVSCVDKTEAANVMMDASFVNGQRNVDDERFVTVKVIDTGTAVEVAPNERDPVLLEGGPQCAGSVEFDEYYGEQVQDDARGMSVEIETNTSMEECNEPLCGGTSSEILASLLLSQFRDVQGSCLNNGDYLIRHEGCPTNADGVEISGIDMQDYDDFNYAAAAANDTDFLNADEDEEAEFTDDHIPNAEETRVTDNSGWSSRTRAVASYLQTLFMREAEHDRKILPMENLLLGKTRKEASRMFFETLVLKTKDYVQVEQECPFQNINIKPKMKLLKSDF